MADVDMARRWDDVDPLLWGGDGSALLVIEHRRVNPPARQIETMPEYWRRIDAVRGYLRSVATWRRYDAGMFPEYGEARRYRREHPGCSFADVVAHVADVNRTQGDG